MARRKWRCFHCDEVFTNPKCAARHFGEDELKEPGCLLRMSEGELSLLGHIRTLERELSHYRAEDGAKDRLLYSMAANHTQALIREEERGYEKGVRDALAMPPEERAALSPSGESQADPSGTGGADA